MVSETEVFTRAIKAAPPEADQVEIIAIMELLAFVAFATEESNAWSGEIVFYVADKQNAQPRLKEEAKDSHRETPHSASSPFRGRTPLPLHPVYIRTYRNQLAD